MTHFIKQCIINNVNNNKLKEMEAMKFVIQFTDPKEGKTFPYSMEATDLYEADERAKKMADGYGWQYVDIEPK